MQLEDYFDFQRPDDIRLNFINRNYGQDYKPWLWLSACVIFGIKLPVKFSFILPL